VVDSIASKGNHRLHSHAMVGRFGFSFSETVVPERDSRFCRTRRLITKAFSEMSLLKYMPDSFWYFAPSLRKSRNFFENYGEPSENHLRKESRSGTDRYSGKLPPADLSDLSYVRSRVMGDAIVTAVRILPGTKRSKRGGKDEAVLVFCHTNTPLCLHDLPRRSKKRRTHQPQ